MRLEALLTFTVEIGESTPIGAGPFGTRAIAEVKGGHFEGPRLRGHIKGPGADWVVFDAEGWGHIDVRMTFVTDDGANVYVSYTGLLEMNDAMRAGLDEGRETAFGDNAFTTHVRFESGDERYAWLNRVIAVGEGRAIPGGVEYRLYACRAG